MPAPAAAWVRDHVWTDRLRTDAKRTVLFGGPCLCQQARPCPACALGDCTDCTDCTDCDTHDPEPAIRAPETVLVGPAGWIRGPGAAVWTWLWLTGRTCTQACGCTCQGGAGVAEAAVQLDLFTTARP